MATISANPFQVDTYIKVTGGGARKNLFAVIPDVTLGTHAQYIGALKTNGGTPGAAGPAAPGVGGLAAAAASFGATVARTLTEGLNIFQHAMLVETTSFPGQTINVIKKKVRGRTANLFGSREWDEWSLKLVQTPSHSPRGYYEHWQNLFSDPDTNFRPLNGTSYTNLYRDMLVLQMNTLGIPTAGMYIVGALPTKVGPLEYDTSSDTELLTCDINFSYQYAQRIEYTAFGAALDVAGLTGTLAF
jgi:hypothetical protein